MPKFIASKANATVWRSFAKTVTWRALGSLDTLLLGYVFSGSLKIAGSIASAEVLTKIGLYYVHERGWAHIRWGVHPGHGRAVVERPAAALSE
jgi:uncharacterized membrane protein